MSRIGNQILTIPAGCEVKVEAGNNVIVKGPKGELSRVFNENLEITVDAGTVKVSRPNETKEMKSLHGTTTALIKNMLVGTTESFKKELELNGVGYRVKVTGKVVNLSVGYSHPVDMDIPEGLSAEAPSNTQLIITGIDKQAVGEFAAQIRKVRPPEPYKGKGIKYKEEVIRRKEGKRAGK
ncbi:50S ribosomal protein L6 [Mollicutes bacterium LVI A0039]|nr:50S ribosomal protein L6 [Mollicutes bacterium LVI A0039]